MSGGVNVGVGIDGGEKGGVRPEYFVEAPLPDPPLLPFEPVPDLPWPLPLPPLPPLPLPVPEPGPVVSPGPAGDGSAECGADGDTDGCVETPGPCCSELPPFAESWDVLPKTTRAMASSASATSIPPP